jgi:hypothetical protein
MAAWKRKALQLFPELRADINGSDYSIYMLFFDLLPGVGEAHELGNEEELAKIYGYAEWALHQRSEDLWNAAGVAFYEHLLEGNKKSMWPMILSWLSPFVLRECEGLWEGRIEGWKDALRLTRDRMERNYQRNVYHTGEIDAL